MTNFFTYILIAYLTLFIINTHFHTQNASELFIYADDISYDQDENLIARGKAKVLYQDKIITSELIIYSKKTGDITLPLEFKLKDERNNYYVGSDGFFKNSLDYGSINNVKILLNDGSRIVGKKAKREKNNDIITKGVYSPCNSKIKIANFLCPIWQLESEKMLHDYDNLFLYQKHSKMRLINLPIFYIPYVVTPSPLRKERKSGFLSPNINLFFFDTKLSQSTSLPYYFNISEDKELTFTPYINYGGGIDSSQRFNFDYNQLVSGGQLSSKLTLDTTFENQNSDKWLKESSIINVYKQNINEKFKLNFSSALQTSKNYIQQTDPNDDLSYSSFLESSLDINGYNLNKLDDQILINLSAYQSNQNNEDNKKIPTILPYVSYFTGTDYYKDINYNNLIEFYNIFRDTSNEVHAKTQRKLSSKFSINKNFIKYSSEINYYAEVYNQYFNVEDKIINERSRSTNYFRTFPILGIDFRTPFKLKNNFKNLIYTPTLSFIVSPGISNSNKLSNEDSSVNSFDIDNISSLNRYTGNDKLDNSKRVNLEFNVQNDNLDASLFQTYEFTENSNFHYSQGNEHNLADLLGNISYKLGSLNTGYNFRFDTHNDFMKKQNIDLNYEKKFGTLELQYLDQKSKTDEIIVSDKETMNYKLASKKINKYSELSYFGLYDLKNEINKESGISYSYFDECFGVNVDFKRNSYTEDSLKPQDILTIMFSFKNVGSYKSTNLAVSEYDKQDIKWDSISIDNDLFN